MATLRVSKQLENYYRVTVIGTFSVFFFFKPRRGGGDEDQFFMLLPFKIKDAEVFAFCNNTFIIKGILNTRKYRSAFHCKTLTSLCFVVLTIWIFNIYADEDAVKMCYISDVYKLFVYSTNDA